MPTYFRPARVDVIEGVGGELALLVLGGALVLGGLAAAIAWVLTNLLLIVAVLGGLGVVSGGVTAAIVRYLYRRHTLVYVSRPAPAPVRAWVVSASASSPTVRPLPGPGRPAIQGKPAWDIPGEGLEGAPARRRGEQA